MRPQALDYKRKKRLHMEGALSKSLSKMSDSIQLYEKNCTQLLWNIYLK